MNPFYLMCVVGGLAAAAAERLLERRMHRAGAPKNPRLARAAVLAAALAAGVAVTFVCLFLIALIYAWRAD